MNTTTPTKALDKPFGEIISCANELAIVQCYKDIVSTNRLKDRIIQGSTVKAVSSYDTSYEAFGLITKINNTSLDTIHKPSALGLNPKELEQLQPQVYELLRKELEIYLFAYREGKTPVVNYPPKKPMMIHDFVYTTTDEELIELSSDLSSLFNLIKKSKLKVDILTDLIKLSYKLRNCNYSYLIKTARVLTSSFSDEVEALMQILRRLSPNLD